LNVRFLSQWRQNLGLKILSVGLAILLWSYVHGAKVVERELVLPLRLVNVPDSLVLIADAPRVARVLVAGPAQELIFRRFYPGAELRIDLANVRPPALRVSPGPADVTLGAKEHLAVLRVVEPAVLELGVDRRIERTLPVRAVWSGRLTPGYEVANPPKIEPATVRCSGPATRLTGWDDVPTRPIDLTSRRATLVERVALDPGHDPVRLQPPAVQVSVEIVRVGRREIADRPVTLRHAPGPNLRVDVRPECATVVLSGPPAALAALDPEDVRLVLDVGALSPGAHSGIPVVAELPSWARLDSVQPATVDVSVEARRR
jgi:hypothetical protein